MSSKCLHVKLGVQDSRHVCYMYIVQCLVGINQLYKVNALSQRDGKHSLSEMVEAYKIIFFFSIRAMNKGNGQPSVNQELFTANSRHSHAVSPSGWTYQPLPVPPFPNDTWSDITTWSLIRGLKWLCSQDCCTTGQTKESHRMAASVKLEVRESGYKGSIGWSSSTEVVDSRCCICTITTGGNRWGQLTPRSSMFQLH